MNQLNIASYFCTTSYKKRASQSILQTGAPFVDQNNIDK